MRRISLKNEPTERPVNTLLIHGDTRTGKTTFAATFPRPYVIADAIEGGWKSIMNSDRSTWWEQDVEPYVVSPENMGEIIGVIVPEIRQRVAQNLTMTVIFDAFSYYTDFYLAELTKLQAKPDMRSIYGQLGMHLRELRNQIHGIGINVVWNTLCKHPDSDDPKGRPLIPGQSADKYSAGVDFLWHSRVEQEKSGDVIKAEHYQMRTRPWRNYIAGHREGQYAGNLPDPFEGSYRDFLVATGYDVDALLEKMPKPRAAIEQKAAIAPPVAKPAPPPVNRSTVSPKAASAPPPAKNNVINK